MKMWSVFLCRNINVEPSYIIEDFAYTGCECLVYYLLSLNTLSG